MALEPFADDELTQALALDVAGTFPQLMENYHQQLYGFVRSQVKDHDLTEEIVQEGWIRAYQALQRYSPEKIRSLKLRAWLFKVVQNEMHTQLGKKNRQGSISVEDLGETLVDDSALSPDEIVELRSRVVMAKEVVAQLSPMARTILTLYLFQELSYQEIAERQRLSIGNVRTHVFRGLQELRRRLAAISN